LRYDEKKMGAPRVVAKGAGEIAARIRELGREHHVPLLEAPPLARALYRHVDLDREIPGPLYNAVAEVLVWAMRLKRNWFKDPRMKILTGPIFIMLVMAMLILPLPPFALDFFFTFNIALSVMVLLVSML